MGEQREMGGGVLRGAKEAEACCNKTDKKVVLGRIGGSKDAETQKDAIFVSGKAFTSKMSSCFVIKV